MVIYDPNKLQIYGFTAEFTCTSVMSDPVTYIYRFNCLIKNCDNSLVNNIFKWRKFVLVPSVKEFYSCLYIGKMSQFVLLK